MKKKSAAGWSLAIDELAGLMHALSVRDRKGVELGPDRGFSKWLELTTTLKKAKRTIYLIGNGASASMASHYAADLAKNARLHTEVFSDLSLITAISNDMGYEHVFEEPLKRRGRQGDMLVCISSSGRSANVLAAARLAVRMGIKVITLSAMRPDNPLRRLGNVNVYAPAENYGDAETCHAAVLHYWMDLVTKS